MNQITVTQYKWAGSFGPFKIRIPCGECAITEGVITDVIATEFPNDKIVVEVLPWLSHWWKPLIRGGWHAPIVLVNNKLVFQGQALDRGLLAYHLRRELSEKVVIPSKGVYIFSKENCKHCTKAKELLSENNMSYTARDVIADPRAMWELFYLTKQFFPKDKPVTTPQIWIDGKYIGGAEELQTYITKK
jgi:glutaredoxin